MKIQNKFGGRIMKFTKLTLIAMLLALLVCAFAACGGTKAFEQLIEDAGLASPFKDGALQTLADKAYEITQTL